jgi:subtilisin family serine protease
MPGGGIVVKHIVKRWTETRIARAIIGMLACAWIATETNSSAFAGNLAPRPPVIKPERTVVDLARHESSVIIVKFHDDLPVRLRNGNLTDFGAGLIGEVQPVLAGIADGRWRPITTVPEDRMDALRHTAQQNLGRAIADMNTYYYLHLPPGVDPAATIDAFNTLTIVEYAAPVPIVVPASSMQSLPGDFEPNQGYLLPAPMGIDAHFAWNELGTRGAGSWIVNIEYGWNENHNDLPFVNLLLGAPQPELPPPPLGWQSTRQEWEVSLTNHGTAVLGQLVSKNNGWGTTGICTDTIMDFGPAYADGGLVWADSIARAANLLTEGGVILIEIQVRGPNYPCGNNCGWLPVEWHKLAYDCIEFAVNNNITVIVPAGNGMQNLDDDVNRPGDMGHYPFDNDSGAIYVGAGAAPAIFGGSDAARSRLSFSNYGKRVNVQGWGERVWTTGYGCAINCPSPGDPNEQDCYDEDGDNLHYTGCFGGTSSASPIVAGAAALLQSAHRIRFGGKTIDPRVLRDTFVATGSLQQDGAYPADDYPIGPLPNVAAAAVALGLADPPALTIAFSPTSLTRGSIAGHAAPAQEIEVWNAGDGVLEYQISTDAEWLSVSPAIGTSGGEYHVNGHTVFYNSASLEPGVYTATIAIDAPGRRIRRRRFPSR